jgi:hypothetical protein
VEKKMSDEKGLRGCLLAVGLGFVLILVALFLRYSYTKWIDYRIQTDPRFMFERLLQKWLGEKSIDQIVPRNTSSEEVVWFRLNDYDADIPPGRIVWVDGSEDRDGWMLLSLRATYGVRIDPSAETLKIDGVPKQGARGFVACVGLDDLVDYTPTETNVIEYDPSNGTVSPGDIVYVFYK